MNSLFSSELALFISQSVEFLSALFIFTVGSVLLVSIIIYNVDLTQKESTILRNHPLFARFRFLFEKIGEFFRQYFFAMGREELSFNRASVTGYIVR
ncbi:hypothetical protein A9Q80_01995 [Cycloclasticus sp. 46_83_sub15_T18]|nr:hypothetical protein A9Q80_01995 [Cycloclasticus sp. 46_83_sub15_T18]